MKLLAILLLVSTMILSQEKPTWNEIQKVVQYKESGKEAVLYQHQITTKLVDLNPIDSVSEIGKDSTAILWLKFLVPAEIEDKNYTVVIKKGPIPKKTKQLTLKTSSKTGALIYRTYISHKFLDEGSHVIEVYFRDDLVQTLNLNVVEM